MSAEETKELAGEKYMAQLLLHVTAEMGSEQKFLNGGNARTKTGESGTRIGGTEGGDGGVKELAAGRAF